MKRARNAFTLVEMLVVITIIGILAGLITAAAVNAMRAAKRAVVSTELSQLDMALKEYKAKFGEFPPDFAGVNDTNATIQTASRNAVLRHLAKAFPRYVPGISTASTGDDHTWDGFRQDVSNPTTGWNLDVNNLTPAAALTFWLGGRPEWLQDAGGDMLLADNSTKVSATKPVTAFAGFSANAANPFDNSASRTQPFYEFNLMCLKYARTDGIATWPTSACDQGTSPLVYFRATNGAYVADGMPTTIKAYGRVYPAIDTRLSDLSATPAAKLTWVNPQAFQIFSAGMDMTYGTLRATTLNGYASGSNALLFPAGTNYAPETYDDITNFSNGTLEAAIKQ